MFTDDSVLLGDNKEKLERLVQEFGRVCQRRKLLGNETKIKTMKIGKNGEENGVNISLNDRRKEEVETHRNIGVDISSDGDMDEEVNHRITETKNAWGSIDRLIGKEAYVSKGKSKNV